MKFFAHLTDSELHESTLRVRAREKEEILQMIEHLCEIDSRGLALKMGYSSLWEYVIQELGYDGASAQRRIDAARMLKTVPSMGPKLKRSEVSLSLLARVEQLSREEQRERGARLTPGEKETWVEKLIGLSMREAEKEIRKERPLSGVHETEKVLTQEKSAVTVILELEALDAISRLKELWSGSDPSISRGEVIAKALKLALVQAEKARRGPVASQSEAPNTSEFPASVATSESSPPPAPEVSRYIRVSHRREIYRETQERCTFVSKITGRRCTARVGIQIEHCLPYAVGGSSRPQNLTLLCSQHNRYRAREFFGR